MRLSGLLVLAAFCAAGAPPVWGACTIAKLSDLPIVGPGNRPIVDGRINGQPVRVLIDTGAAGTLIDESAAQKLGLKLEGLQGMDLFGVGGEIRVSATQLQTLQIGMFSGKNVRITVIRRKAAAADRGFDVIMGEDLLSRVALELDLGNNAIRFLRAEGCRPEQMVYWAKSFSIADLDPPTALHLPLCTTIVLGGIKVGAVLDTGASVSVVTRETARRAGVNRPDTGGDARASVGLNGVRIETWVATFDTLSIGDDETIRNVKMRVGDLFAADQVETTGSHIRQQVDMPGVLIGHDFLMAHRVVVLFKERKLLLTYNGGAVFRP